MKPRRIVKRFGMFLVGIVLAAVMALVLGVIVMALWNWLMPELFGTPFISFLQALGLMLLARIVLGHGGRHRRHMHSSHWSNDWPGEGDHEQHVDESDAPASEPA